MISKFVGYTLLGIIVTIGYNAFLIKRDAELFKAYDHTTTKEAFCASQAKWHTDCNVE